MAIFAGSDVSHKTTQICAADTEGMVVRRDVVASDPAILARWPRRYCAGLTQVMLETRHLSALFISS